MALSWSYEDLRADGVSLKNYGFGISLVGGLSGVPPRAGSNASVAYRRGALFRPKVFGQVTKSLTMWVDCRDPDTGLYAPGANHMARVGQRNENLQQIYRIFGNPKVQINLARDIVLAGGSKETWTAKCEYAGDALNVNFNDNSDEETNFNIDLLFADPFWYGPLYTGPTITAGGGAFVVANSGDLDAVDLTVTISAVGSTLVNPVLTNSTNGVSFTINTSISSGDSVVVETKYPRVKRTSDSANLIGSVTSSGARQFMTAERGNNNMTLTATSGAGNAVVSFYPPHF